LGHIEITYSGDENMKILLLGIAFVLAGVGCMSFPEPFGALYVIGLACLFVGLLLAIVGTVKKEEPGKR
jgi:starvation-inducible outer membrane lipoprotein